MVAFPRPLPDTRWASFSLDLERFVSASLSGGRVANVVEYADPVWSASFSTKAMHHLALRPVEAWWSSLRDGMRSVLYRHPSYKAPMANIRARGPEVQAGAVTAVAGGNVLTISGVAAGLTLSAGDFITFESGALRGLARVIEASGGGTARTVEIEPSFPRHLPIGSTARFDRAELIMRPVSGSFSISEGTVRTASFQLMESRA
jgi:hypothetical protein